MMSFCGRRVLLACLFSVAGLVAVIAPGIASAATQTSDLDKQCEGNNIVGHGSTFQAPILVKWAVDFNEFEGLPNKNKKACGGTQGSKQKPTVEYQHTGSEAGSGSCLKGMGAERKAGEETKYAERPFCGTDEAPNPNQKKEIEENKTGGEGESLETIPVLQGAVAVIVHLPAECHASSEILVKGAATKLERLVLDRKTVEGVFKGSIKTWEELLTNQANEGTGSNKGAGDDKITCKEAAKLKDTIQPVVRLDHSGTTHIFKSFLEQVNPSETIPMETPYKECATEPPADEKWSEVAEACQNQRWPAAAKVERGTESGNQGVVKRVNEVASSMGYADLAVAREFGFFSKSGEGGEGEEKFWVEVQDTKNVERKGFHDPSTDGDTTAPANSSCKTTKYTEETGKKFPPENTRKPWNEAKAELVEKEYSICGLTYDLALRQYGFYPGKELGEEIPGKKIATAVHDFLLWALNTTTDGGGKVEAGTDYEKLPTAIIKKAEQGVEELGWKKAGTAGGKEKT